MGDKLRQEDIVKLLIGGALGAAVALLLAPMTGKELRELLAAKAAELIGGGDDEG